MTFYQRTAYFQSDMIRAALKMYGGNNCHAAEFLGVHRNTLLRLRHKFGMGVRPRKKSICIQR